MGKFKLNDDDSQWFYDYMHVKLEKKHKIKYRNLLDYGCQFILEGGAVVNLFYTCRFQCQGTASDTLYKEVEQLVGRFRWMLQMELKAV